MRQADLNLVAAYKLGRDGHLPGQLAGLCDYLGCSWDQAEGVRTALMAAGLATRDDEDVLVAKDHPRRSPTWTRR